MNIDLVYLWVDGNDPKWRDKKNAALVAAGRPVSELAIVANRFEQNDELKYSLRSVVKFAPWVNHIFIVTDGQTPEWLDLKNPKITVVDLSEIVPKKYLPLFNSAAIEMFLHKIPNLSEHFLYANDDMFFGKSVDPHFFFDEKGDPIVILHAQSWSRAHYLVGSKAVSGVLKRDTLFPKMVANALAATYKLIGEKYKLILSHAIEPMRKSYLAEIIDLNDNYFMETTATTFRDASNIQRFAFPMINHARGRTTIVYKQSYFNRRIKYMPRTPPFWTSFLMWLGRTTGLSKINLVDSTKGVERPIRKTLRYNPELFCLNYIAPEKKKIAADFMNRMFPEKSEFEK
ncbi:MAG: Stealth CR1 domain-containing protein [Rickettsiales bacterium]|nr:Stealth CR1 domain-containing protein [Rickettsiales bacterium]